MNYQALETEVMRNARWLIQLRWVAGIVIVAGILSGFLVGLIPTYAIELLVIGAGVLTYNGIAAYLLRRGSITSSGQVQIFWLVRILADMSALSGIIYYNTTVAGSRAPS